MEITPSDYYHNLNAMINDSNLRITMEHYGYNIWAFLSIILVLLIIKFTDTNNLYNYVLIITIVMLYTTYMFIKILNK